MLRCLRSLQVLLDLPVVQLFRDVLLVLKELFYLHKTCDLKDLVRVSCDRVDQPQLRVEDGT